MTYRKRRNAPSLSVIPKAASSLAELKNGGGNVTMVDVVPDGDVDVYTVRYNQAIGESNSGFIYLEVNAN